MTAPHPIALVAYEGFQLLDVCGPAAVFAAANEALARRVYDVRIVSPAGGLVASGSGVALATQPLSGLRARRLGTLLIAGGRESALRRARRAHAGLVPLADSVPDPQSKRASRSPA